MKFKSRQMKSRGVLPSSQRKSGSATSCRGISLRKAGRWQRGFPVTILRFLNQPLSHASLQLQLNGLASRFLPKQKCLNHPESKGIPQTNDNIQQICYLFTNEKHIFRQFITSELVWWAVRNPASCVCYILYSRRVILRTCHLTLK